MKKSSNLIWALILAGVVVISAAVGIYLYTRPMHNESSGDVVGPVALVYLDGKLYDAIDLGSVKENYMYTVKGISGLTNDIEVEPGRVRVCRADCPDQICVSQGWLDNDFIPIACLPNTLVIQVTSAEDLGLDGMAG